MSQQVKRQNGDQLRQLDSLDFKMNVNYKTGKKETVYFVKSHCSYPNSAQAHLLANTIQHNFQIASNLKEHLKLYEEFIKKYEGTMASRCTNSNYAENEVIYKVLCKIYSYNTSQGKCSS